MNRPNINIRIVTETGEIPTSIRINFPTMKYLEAALSNALPLLAITGTLQVECNDANISFGDIPIEKNSNEERSKHYRKTGN